MTKSSLTPTIAVRRAGSALFCALIALSGCSQINELLGDEESVDYQSATRAEPLTIPPDLTQINQSATYRAPEGVALFSQYQGQGASTAMSGANPQVLPQQRGMTVMRDGNLRWLSVDRPAEVVYPQLIDFWQAQGFTIASQNPAAGLLETDWAENRKKIPESWLRNILRIVDQVFDSGERERFRTRLERVGDKTEIYISHEQMVEKSADNEVAFRWVPGQEDPNLNAAMLARLMVFLGSDIQEARDKIAQSVDVSAPIVQAPDRQTTALTLAESFDRAWRRVGVAIDSAGFSVEDRDRSTGDYFIRYLDTDSGVQREQGNFFTRLFRSSATTEAEQYRIHLTEQGASTRVIVQNAQGQHDESTTAQRILSVLSGHMR